MKKLCCKEIYRRFERPDSEKGFFFVYANVNTESGICKIITDDEYGNNVGLKMSIDEFKDISNSLNDVLRAADCL